VWWLSGTVPGWRPEASPGGNPPASVSVWWCPVFGRVARGGLATTVLVGAVSFGMVGQASATPIAPVAPVLIGGTQAAGGAAIACALNPLCIVPTAAVAVGAVALYATRDTWMPWVEGLFSGDDSGSTASPAGSYIDYNSSQHSPTLLSPSTVGWTITENVGNKPLRYTVNYACNNGGVVNWVTLTSVNTGNATNLPHEHYPSVTCTGGGQIVAVETVPPQNLYWYPANQIYWSGNGGLPEESRTYRATAECVKPDGSVQNLVVEYAGTAGVGGFLIPSCQDAGIGDHAKSVDVDVKLPGRTDFREAWDVTAPSQPTYPDCDPTMSTGCELSVWVDGSVCNVGDSRCLDWQEHASSRLQCHWGPYSVPIAKCDMLEEAYKPGGARIAEENTDGDPSTGTATAADPSATPSSPGFPTAVPIPPTPSPVPVPTVDTPVDVDSGCWPSGSAAWNPLEWVLRPVQCALVWAFVPPEGMGTRMAEFSTAWDGSDAGTWVSTITDPVGDVSAAWSSGGAGCGGPEWTLSMAAFGGGSYPFRPFDSCREPLASVAPVVKGVGVALVFVIGFRAAANPVLGALGLPRIPGRRQLWQHEIHGD
jgi:hypothetical protein